MATTSKGEFRRWLDESQSAKYKNEFDIPITCYDEDHKEHYNICGIIDSGSDLMLRIEKSHRGKKGPKELLEAYHTIKDIIDENSLQSNTSWRYVQNMLSNMICDQIYKI